MGRGGRKGVTRVLHVLPNIPSWDGDYSRRKVCVCVCTRSVLVTQEREASGVLRILSLGVFFSPSGHVLLDLKKVTGQPRLACPSPFYL